MLEQGSKMCPDCAKKNQLISLQLYQSNLQTAMWMCPECAFPLMESNAVVNSYVVVRSVEALLPPLLHQAYEYNHCPTPEGNRLTQLVRPSIVPSVAMHPLVSDQDSASRWQEPLSTCAAQVRAYTKSSSLQNVPPPDPCTIMSAEQGAQRDTHSSTSLHNSSIFVLTPPQEPSPPAMRTETVEPRVASEHSTTLASSVEFQRALSDTSMLPQKCMLAEVDEPYGDNASAVLSGDHRSRTTAEVKVTTTTHVQMSDAVMGGRAMGGPPESGERSPTSSPEFDGFDDLAPDDNAEALRYLTNADPIQLLAYLCSQQEPIATKGVDHDVLNNAVQDDSDHFVPYIVYPDHQVVQDNDLTRASLQKCNDDFVDVVGGADTCVPCEELPAVDAVAIEQIGDECSNEFIDFINSDEQGCTSQPLISQPMSEQQHLSVPSSVESTSENINGSLLVSADAPRGFLRQSSSRIKLATTQNAPSVIELPTVPAEYSTVGALNAAVGPILSALQTHVAEVRRRKLRRQRGSEFIKLLDFEQEDVDFDEMSDLFQSDYSWRCQQGHVEHFQAECVPLEGITLEENWNPAAPSCLNYCEECGTDVYRTLQYRRLPPFLIYYLEQGMLTDCKRLSTVTIGAATYKLVCLIALGSQEGEFLPYTLDPERSRWCLQVPIDGTNQFMRKRLKWCPGGAPEVSGMDARVLIWEFVNPLNARKWDMPHKRLDNGGSSYKTVKTKAELKMFSSSLPRTMHGVVSNSAYALETGSVDIVRDIIDGVVSSAMTMGEEEFEAHLSRQQLPQVAAHASIALTDDAASHAISSTVDAVATARAAKANTIGVALQSRRRISNTMNLSSSSVYDDDLVLLKKSRPNSRADVPVEAIALKNDYDYNRTISALMKRQMKEVSVGNAATKSSKVARPQAVDNSKGRGFDKLYSRNNGMDLLNMVLKKRKRIAADRNVGGDVSAFQGYFGSSISSPASACQDTVTAAAAECRPASEVDRGSETSGSDIGRSGKKYSQLVMSKLMQIANQSGVTAAEVLRQPAAPRQAPQRDDDAVPSVAEYSGGLEPVSFSARENDLVPYNGDGASQVSFGELSTTGASFSMALDSLNYGNHFGDFDEPHEYHFVATLPGKGFGDVSYY